MTKSFLGLLTMFIFVMALLAIECKEDLNLYENGWAVLVCCLGIIAGLILMIKGIAQQK
jgi:hypothetical protein